MTAITTDLSSGYSPPGVYIAESSDPVSVSTGLPPGRLTLIGRGQGAQRATEQISLNTDGVRLTQKGIDQASLVVRSVSNDAEIPASQYTVEEQPQSDGDQDYYLRIFAVVPDGEETIDPVQVWVSYTFVPVGYFAPRIFTDPNDVRTLYGPGISSTVDPEAVNPINSPLTLAAEIAFANGAPEILVVPLDLVPGASSTSVREAISAAYGQIGADYASSIVVPLFDGLESSDVISAAGDLRGHVALSSANGYYRVGIFGPPLSYTGSPSDLLASGGLAYSRLIMAYASPQGMVYRSNVSGARMNVGHQYLAVAYGARMASNPVQQSLTRRPITGFSDVGSRPNATQKNSWAAAGVALTERDRNQRMIIRHGTSTDRSDLVAAEPSVTRARDVMVAMIQSALDDSSLIGSPMDDNSPMAVKSIVAGVLEYCVTNNIIVAYNPTQVRMASLNPSVIEVRFGYRPSFPLNYIMVNFAIDLNTGQTDGLDETTGTALG